MRFRYRKEAEGWRWRLLGDDDEIIATGETFPNKEGCLHSIHRVQLATIFTTTIEEEPTYGLFDKLMGSGLLKPPKR